MYIVSFEHEALKILNFAPAYFQGTLNKYQIENDTFDKIFTGRNTSQYSIQHVSLQLKL